MRLLKSSSFNVLLIASSNGICYNLSISSKIYSMSVLLAQEEESWTSERLSASSSRTLNG